MTTTGRDRRVFVDTSAYSAATDRRDASHATVSATFERMITERRRLVTTNVVLIELHALLLIRLGRQVAANAVIELRASQSVVRVRARDEARAEAIIAQYDVKDFSLTDAISFAVMKRLGITQALSLDRHFAQFGWHLVLLDTRPPAR